MELLVENEHAQDSVVKVRWCLKPNELRLLKSDGCLNPFLLIVVSREIDPEIDHCGRSDEELQRMIVPLGQMMHYISFSRPGVNIIQAQVILNVSNRPIKEYRTKLLARDRYDEFEERLLSYDGSLNLNYYEESKRMICRLDIDVDPKFFAKEPSDFERWWVNLWFERPPREQCDFRKRRFLAYSIQPVIVAVWVALIVLARGFIALFSVLLGNRNTLWSAVVHPFRYITADVFRLSDLSSVFWEDKDGNLRRWFVRAINPPTVIFVALLLSPLGLGFFQRLLLAPFVILAIVGCVWGAVRLIIHVLSVIPDKLSKRNWSWKLKTGQEDVKRKAKMEAENAKQRELLDKQYAPLLCSVVYKSIHPLDLSSLPTNKRTIKLKFLDLKSRVCRPYAR